jgi:ATP-dependent Clp protease ATP-binding subunit ClpB
LLLQFEGERRRAEELKALMAKRDALLARLEQAQLRNDIVSAADILHGALPEVREALAAREAEAAASEEGRLLRDTVTEEDIAQIVGRWCVEMTATACLLSVCFG